MTKPLILVAIPIMLASCSGGAGPANSSYPWDTSALRSAGNSNSDCGYVVEPDLNPNKGGKMIIPPIPSSGDFSGYAGYAPLSAQLHVSSLFFSCPNNAYNIPVPQGYTPDWFGYWDVCNGTCAFSFEDADLKMQLKSATWVPKRTYYLYVYTTTGGVLMTSYPIGVVKNKKETLKFSTPFENGLTWPANDTISLEIVHAT